MAQQKKKRKNKGYNLGHPPGMNLATMMRIQREAEENAKDFAKDELQRVLADRQAQKMAWLYICALNEKFDFGAKRTDELEEEVKRMAAEYKKMSEENDQDYADEKLRARVSQIRGHEVRYAHEDLYPVNADRKCTDVGEEELTAIRESESRIY